MQYSMCVCARSMGLLTRYSTAHASTMQRAAPSMYETICKRLADAQKLMFSFARCRIWTHVETALIPFNEIHFS